MKRVLFDNCVPIGLLDFIENHEAVHASHRGWETLSNGNLLTAAESEGFDVVVTVDKNFSFQQHLANRQISLITLNTRLTRLTDLLPLVPELNRILESVEPGIAFLIDTEPS